MIRTKSALGLGLAFVLLTSLLGCCKLFSRKDDDDRSTKRTKEKTEDFVASIAFRPEKNGYSFKNRGGKYPRSPGLVDTGVMVQLFGADACLGRNKARCRLTPPAKEWANMINRAMNGGQCEGMAVSSLTFFQGIDKPSKHKRGAKTAHDLSHTQVSSLIGYYWAYQAVNPVMREVVMGRRRTTPVQALDQLKKMLKKKELTTVAIFAPPPYRGGHAVTPYAIEDRGNNKYWIRVYDNNYPDQSRHIEVDKEANTWRYDVAALNPNETKMPWTGNAETRSLVLIPLKARLAKAECPFCRSSGGRRVVMSSRGSAISISDPEGRKTGYDGDELVNEVPGVEVMNLAAFLPDAVAPEPIFTMPDDVPYDIQISGSDQPPADEDGAQGDEDATGLAVFGAGTVVALGQTERAAGESDTVSLATEGVGVKLRTGTGTVPSVRLGVDEEGSGYVVRLKNIKADAGDEVDVLLDASKGNLRVQGGGKSTESYDLRLRRTHAEGEDEEVDQKGVKFRLGESHSINVRQAKIPPGAKRTLPIQRGRFVPPAKKAPAAAGKEGPAASSGPGRPGAPAPAGNKPAPRPGTAPTPKGPKTPSPAAPPRPAGGAPAPLKK